MAKRAANNMGTVRQRSDGRWEGRYTDPNGKQRSVYAPTQSECTALLRAAQSDIDNGVWQRPSTVTVAQWLDIWLSDYQGDNSERTVLKYRSVVNNNFKPIIGNVKITNLSTIHIRRMLKNLKDKGLSQVTISNYHRIFKTAINAAIEAKLINTNPADEISVARGKVKGFHIVEKSQFGAFISAAKETKYENELAFMLYTGLRIGELRGLRWSDIDFKAKTMHIQRQLHPKSQIANRITQPKYEEERTLYLASAAIDVLNVQRKRQAAQRLSAGSEWHEDEVSKDLVFRKANGDPHGEKTLLDAVHAAGKRIGIPELHPHDLRHSFAVAAIRAKMDVKSVQHNLGHKKADMTMDVYVKYTEDAGKEGAERLSEYFSN